MDERMERRTDRWKDGRADGRTDGWTDRWTDCPDLTSYRDASPQLNINGGTYNKQYRILKQTITKEMLTKTIAEETWKNIHVFKGR